MIKKPVAELNCPAAFLQAPPPYSQVKSKTRSIACNLGLNILSDLVNWGLKPPYNTPGRATAYRPTADNVVERLKRRFYDNPDYMTWVQPVPLVTLLRSWIRHFTMIISACWPQTSSKFTWEKIKRQPKTWKMVNF